MIQIRINNTVLKKQEYSDAITDKVALRVSILKKSISHLNGGAFDFSEGDLVSFRTITKEIISTVGDNINIPNGRNGYSNSITNYIANANSLGNINLAGLLQFCQYLLANNNQQLSNLLVCSADNLMNLGNAILHNHAINTDANVEIIKLAFDYQKYNKDISAHIRDYFRLNDFTKICSYCNMEPAIHKINKAGQQVRSYELDHFYDKSRYPLFCYSLFNLVPSDHTCNVTNKGDTKFSDDYHLNPHFMGYLDRISFAPIVLSTAYDVSKVEVKILEPQGTAMYRRVNGNNQPDEEQGELGNLNVFKIRSKYEDETFRASHLLKTIHKENKNYKHIWKYVEALSASERKVNYVKWYEKELNVRFNATDFNNKSFSKFSRDIHDYYYLMNKNRWNRYIIDLIESG